MQRPVATLLGLLECLLLIGSAGIHSQLDQRQKLSKLLSTMINEKDLARWDPDAARQHLIDVFLTMIQGITMWVLIMIISCLVRELIRIHFYGDVQIDQEIDAELLEVQNHIRARYHVIEIGPNHVYLQNRNKSPKRPVIRGSDRETDDPTRCCVICTVNEKQCTVVPCGHVIYCISCANKRQETKCPMCRKSMKQVIRIFI